MSAHTDTPRPSTVFALALTAAIIRRQASTYF